MISSLVVNSRVYFYILCHWIKCNECGEEGIRKCLRTGGGGINFKSSRVSLHFWVRVVGCKIESDRVGNSHILVTGTSCNCYNLLWIDKDSEVVIVWSVIIRIVDFASVSIRSRVLVILWRCSV